jgi:hypothetical protein
MAVKRSVEEMLQQLLACDSREQRLMLIPSLSPVQLEVLVQLSHAVWDGYIISKQARSDLVHLGLAERWNGWNFATRFGFIVLDTLRMLPTQHTSKD